MRSWRPTTRKQYSTYINQWLEFCREQQITYHSPSMKQALDFLMRLRNKGFAYSTINTAQSSLSNIFTEGDCVGFGSLPVVNRFMKAVFEAAKPKTKTMVTWDVSIFLTWFQGLYLHSLLHLKYLTFKLLLLILLMSAQRRQTMCLLSLEGMIQRDDMHEFHLLDHLKTSTPRSSPTVLTVKAYPANEHICPVRTLCAYLERTAELRGLEQRLFLSYQMLHKHVSRDTICR